MTAPSANTTENLGRIIEKGWAARPQDVVELHDHYNGISRKMAEKWDETLVDLVDIFARNRNDALLHCDGIHLSPKGHELVAQSLVTAIAPILESRLTEDP